jgi:hypothetical protein
MTFSATRNGAALLVVLTSVGAFAACAPGELTEEERLAELRARPCTAAPDTVLGKAVSAFIRTAQPAAYRYLIPVGTDSVVPRHGHWALQDRTPLMLYPSDPALQKQQITQLFQRGNYTTLLVSFHGEDTLPDGRRTMEFSGNYLGGQHAGKTVPHTTIVFDCHATGDARWTVGGAAPIQADTNAKSPPPA